MSKYHVLTIEDPTPDMKVEIKNGVDGTGSGWKLSSAFEEDLGSWDSTVPRVVDDWYVPPNEEFWTPTLGLSIPKATIDIVRSRSPFEGTWFTTPLPCVGNTNGYIEGLSAVDPHFSTQQRATYPPTAYSSTPAISIPGRYQEQLVPAGLVSSNHDDIYTYGLIANTQRDIEPFMGYTFHSGEARQAEFERWTQRHDGATPSSTSPYSAPLSSSPASISSSPASISSSLAPSYVRASSGFKTPSSRTRTRSTPRHQHHLYLDSLLRSKCPKDRLEALDIAIRFRNEHPSTELIPNELLDELMEPADGDKYYCLCCPRSRKARTITPCRDHVRKSLGNFPFQCPNSWCHHSSLRQADLNKHMRTCTRAK